MIIFRLRKTNFLIKRIDIWRCRTPLLPPNAASEPWNFDRCGKLTSTVPPINDGWFETALIRAFFSYMGLWGFYVVLRPTCYGILEHPVWYVFKKRYVLGTCTVVYVRKQDIRHRKCLPGSLILFLHIYILVYKTGSSHVCTLVTFFFFRYFVKKWRNFSHIFS
jgi:hypothetical protein